MIRPDINFSSDRQAVKSFHQAKNKGQDSTVSCGAEGYILQFMNRWTTVWPKKNRKKKSGKIVIVCSLWGVMFPIINPA